jgi:DNA-binding CsgD family transcriptional regulator
MAADGLTNRETGQRLYLSHRTIGSSWTGLARGLLRR